MLKKVKSWCGENPRIPTISSRNPWRRLHASIRPRRACENNKLLHEQTTLPQFAFKVFPCVPAITGPCCRARARDSDGQLIMNSKHPVPGSTRRVAAPIHPGGGCERLSTRQGTASCLLDLLDETHAFHVVSASRSRSTRSRSRQLVLWRKLSAERPTAPDEYREFITLMIDQMSRDRWVTMSGPPRDSSQIQMTAWSCRHPPPPRTREHWRACP